MSQASDPLEGRTIAITGGTGFLGRRVTELVTARGGTARTIALRDSGETRPDIVADLTRSGAAEDALAGADYVVHLAARSGGIGFQNEPDWSVWTDNTTTTSHILKAAVTSGVRGVFLASSAVVYEPLASGPIPEANPLIAGPDAGGVYAWSKVCDEAAGEWFFRTYGLKVAAGRFTTIYGPRDPGHRPGATVIEDLIHRARGLDHGEPLVVWGDGSQVRSFIHVDDVATAVLQILTGGTPGSTYNVDTGIPTSIAGLADLILRHVAPASPLTFDPSKPSGVPYRVLDPGRLRKLGWEPAWSLEGGIAQLVS